jgi:pimeloyl-ACP methyl ester carboxylesterase
MVARSTTPGSLPRATKVNGPDGVATTIHDFGGDGPVLLFAHATGMHGWVWKPVIDHLVDRAHCVAIDLRGHGDSALPPGSDLNWDGFGSDVLTVVRALGDGKVIGVGHSLGGAALLMAELEAPGSFQRMLLYEPAVHDGMGDGGSELLTGMVAAMVELTKRRRATFPSLADALANYMSKPPMAEFEAAALDAYVSHGFAERLGDGEHGVALKCAPEIEAQIYAASFSHDTAQRLDEITCPVTLATGTGSDLLQRRTTEALAAQFDTTRVVLHGVGHFGPMQQPRQFAEVVASHALQV